MRPRLFRSFVFLIIPALIVMPGHASGDSRRYRPPTSAPVTGRFRPPAGPYSAGNRGLDYATTAGSTVGAIGDGVVVFAGVIAHQLFVTVLHPDGLRSSYSYLATISVSLGESVRAGQAIGTATNHLQLGVRRGATYIDPAGLFGGGRPRLVRPAASASNPH